MNSTEAAETKEVSTNCNKFRVTSFQVLCEIPRHFPRLFAELVPTLCYLISCTYFCQHCQYTTNVTAKCSKMTEQAEFFLNGSIKPKQPNKHWHSPKLQVINGQFSWQEFSPMIFPWQPPNFVTFPGSSEKINLQITLTWLTVTTAGQVCTGTMLTRQFCKL